LFYESEYMKILTLAAQNLVNSLITSKLPSSLQELRITGGHPLDRNTNLSDPIHDRMQLDEFARRQPKLKYAAMSLAGERFEWSTYGMIP
jgi:hypothetical protein